MTRGEERTSIFLITALCVGPLTEAITRFVSLMRLTPSAIICFIIGIFMLGVLLMHMGLAD